MKPKLTEELIEVMCGLKAKGMHNKDICMAVGIHEATLYCWLNKASSKLHRALDEEFKKRKLSTSRSCWSLSARRPCPSRATGLPPPGCLSESIRRSLAVPRRERPPLRQRTRPRSCSASRCARLRATQRIRMVKAADLVIPSFHDVLGDVMAHGHTHYWMHGG